MKQKFHWAGTAHLLLAAAQQLGVPQEKVLEQAGITKEDLPPSPGRMAWPLLAPLVKAAIQLTGEPGIGLLAGRLGTVHLHGVAGAYYMHLSPPRVSQEFAYHQVWSRLSNLMRFRHEVVGERVLHRGELAPGADPLMEPLLHVWLTTHVAAYCGVFGEKVEVEHVALRSNALGRRERLAELAGRQVLTGQPGDWVSVPKGLVERRMPLADPWLRDQLRPQIEAFLRTLDDEQDATLAVREALEAALQEGAPTDLIAIATTLGWKPRTLRSRLAVEETSFSDVLDAERKEFALQLIAAPGAKLAAVAAQTGFSDPAAFTRAFRRWTGVTPMQWRNGQGLEAAVIEASRPDTGLSAATKHHA